MDNDGLGIILNGTHSIASQVEEGFSGYATFADTNSADFNVGSNTLDFYVYNEGTYTGVRVDDLVLKANGVQINGQGTNFIGVYPAAQQTYSNTVQLAMPMLTKAVVATNDSGVALPHVLIGDTVTYRLVTQVPRSTSTTFTLVDNLPTGLSFVSGSTSVAFVGLTPSDLTSSDSAIQGLSGLDISSPCRL